MPKLVMDYDLATAILKDTANRRMRKAGRTAWSRSDYHAGIDAFYRCFGTTCAQYHADMLAGKPDPIPPRGRR